MCDKFRHIFFDDLVQRNSNSCLRSRRHHFLPGRKQQGYNGTRITHQEKARPKIYTFFPVSECPIRRDKSPRGDKRHFFAVADVTESHPPATQSSFRQQIHEMNPDTLNSEESVFFFLLTALPCLNHRSNKSVNACEDGTLFFLFQSNSASLFVHEKFISTTLILTSRLL